RRGVHRRRHGHAGGRRPEPVDAAVGRWRRPPASDAGRADSPRRRLRAAADLRRGSLPSVPDRGIPLLMRSLRTLVVLGVVAAVAPGRTEVRFVDSVVAEVEGTEVTASDIALARALGLFGLVPAAGSLSAGEVDRYADGRLLVREATRIGVEVAEADRAAA